MSFKSWCLREFPTHEAENATHLFMDKGKINVPSERYPEFLKKYYEYMNIESICLIEKLGKRYLMRFFLDVDLKQSDIDFAYVLTNIYETANNIVGIIGDIYECSEKRGYHIIFNKVVTCDEAKLTVDKIIRKLDIQLQQFIDVSVYNTGLRMVGSCKFSNKGLEKRRYIPMHNECTFDVFKKSIVQIQKVAMIDNTTSIKMTESKSLLDEYLTKTFGRTMNVISVKKLGHYISCTTNSKYCDNIQDYHKNAHVYYVFDTKKRVCYQKCFCACIKPNLFTTCRNYKGVQHKVTYVVNDFLLQTC